MGPRWGVVIQALIAAVRRPAAQRKRNAAQAVIAAQLRWSTTAREGRTAVARQTAASRQNVLAAPVAGKRLRAVKQSDDALLMIFCSQYLAQYFAHDILPVMFHLVSGQVPQLSLPSGSGNLTGFYPSCKNGTTYLTD